LLNTDEDPHSKKITNVEIAKILKIGMRTIDRIKKRFVEEGFDACLSRKPTTRIYERKVDGEVEAKLISIACSKPPEGFSKWSLRLLADKMVELQYIESISHETVIREVEAWKTHRNNKNASIDWQFTTKDARIKLKRLYPQLILDLTLVGS